MKPRFVARFVTLPLAAISFTHAQSTFNTANDGGNWGIASNWTPATVPNAADAEAIVNGAGPSGTAPATLALDVLLDGNYKIGRLTRSADGGQPATFPTTPTGFDVTKGLTLEKSSGTPEINVVGNVFYYGSIFGNQGFDKTGAGRFTLRFNGIEQTYTGPVKISGGTLGIEKDRSLGAVDNDIEIAGGARLFAEPGANTGTITLPATRSISLRSGSVAAQQIGSSPAQVSLIIEGNITEADPSGVTKTDAGVLALSGTNTWTGTTTVSGGVLSLVKPQSLPGYDPLGPSFSQTYNVADSTTLAVRYGDASTWTVDQINALVGTASFNTTGSFGFDTTGNAVDTEYADDIAAAGSSRITKLGAGKLTLSGSPGLTRITMYDGTLALGGTSSIDPAAVLVFNKSGAVIDLGTKAVSVSDLIEFNGGSSTITNGSLTYTGPTLTLSGNNGTTTDLSGLTAFTYSTSGSELKLENANNVNASQNTTLFASGTNTITASTRVLVGGGPSNSNGTHLNTARFGTTNTINTNLLQLGAFNNAGLVNFQTGLTAPSMKIRAANGSDAIPSLVIGETSSGVRSGAGTLDLTGGSADILAGSIVVGRHISNSNSPNTTSTISVTDGTVSATTLTLVRKQGTGSPATLGIFNQGGGNVAVDSVIMVETADNTAPNVASATQNLQATYNLDGGTLTAGEIKRGLLATPITAGNTQRNLILRGGTLINKSGADLTISGVTVLAAGNTTAVVNSTTGQKVVLAADATYAARINSATPGAGTLQVDGDLDISASPAFTIFDDAPTDAALIPGGTKLVLIDYQDGSLTGTFSGLADGATVSVTKGTVTNEFILDYDDPAYGGKAVTLTVPAGSGFGAWITGTFANGTVPSGQQGPQDDPDGDGIDNLIEYAVAGLDPTQANGAVGTQTGLTITYLKRQPLAGDITYAIESSDDLGGFDDWAPASGVTQDDNQISVTLTNPGDNFARLKVTEN